MQAEFPSGQNTQYNKYFFMRMHRASKASNDEASKNFALEKLKQNSKLRKGCEDELAILSGWFNRAALARLRETLNAKHSAPASFYSDAMLKKYAALKVKSAAKASEDINKVIDTEVAYESADDFLGSEIAEYKEGLANKLCVATKFEAGVTKYFLAEIKKYDDVLLDLKARRA